MVGAGWGEADGGGEPEAIETRLNSLENRDGIVQIESFSFHGCRLAS